MAATGGGEQAGVDVMADNGRLLVVDDDAELRQVIAEFLGDHGFSVASAADAGEMDQALARERFDLVVLDVMMPGESGLSVARRIAADGGPPVVMLSALGDDIDRIVGLEVGADDYLPKPCNPRELLARVRAVLRRAGARGEPEAVQGYRFAGWRIDPAQRLLVDPKGQDLVLSEGEFAILVALVEHPRRVLTRDQLLTYARGPDSDAFDRAIDTQISRIRRRLGERDPSELIRTIRNEGYYFVPKVERA